MLTFVAQTFKYFLIVQESLEYLGLRISIEAVGIPLVRIPGIEEKTRALLLPGGQEDLAVDLAEAPHLPGRLAPGLRAAGVGLVTVRGAPVEEGLQAGQRQHAGVRRAEVGLGQIEPRSEESETQTHLLVGLKDILSYY